jgi:hypothetical protein
MPFALNVALGKRPVTAGRINTPDYKLGNILKKGKIDGDFKKLFSLGRGAEHRRREAREKREKTEKWNTQ